MNYQAIAAIVVLTPALGQAQLKLPAETGARCVEILRQGLRGVERTETFWPAMHAAEALTLAGRGDEVRTALEPLLGTEKDDQHRCGLSRELVRAGDKGKVSLMLDVLAKADPYGHTHAAESLFKVGEIGDGKLLRQAMAAEDAKCQLMAAAALAKRGDAGAMALLRKSLAGHDAESRKNAAWILSWIGDETDLAQVRRNLESEKEPLNRAYFVNSLANLGDRSGREELGRNLGSPDAAIRTYAAEYAGHCGAADAAGKLATLLDDHVLDVRVRAAQSLIALVVQARNTDLLRHHLADYDTAPRGKDGRVEVDALVARLKELGVTAYYWLIWHAATDWDDLKLFLPKAAAAGIEVWPYLVPPTESAPRLGTKYPEPFRLDYPRWAEEIAKLSLQHPNLTGWVIDDFYGNRDLYTPAYVHGMQARAKLVNPQLAFLPLMYFRELRGGFVEAYRKVIDGAVVAYLQDRDEIERSWGWFNDATVPLASELSYPWGVASRPGDFIQASQKASVEAAERYQVSFREVDDFTAKTAGYHFKQLLVNGEVVWEEDVAGGEPKAKAVTVDVSAQVKGKSSVELAFRILDKQGVANFGLSWQLSDLQAVGLKLAAGLKDTRSWAVKRQGAFETGFGAEPKPGRHRFHVPYVSMTAAVAYEFRMRHGDPASPERMTEWLRLSLQAWKERKCDGVVTYCLEKQPDSRVFPLARDLFHQFGAGGPNAEMIRK